MAGMPPARRRSPSAAPSPDISPADYGPHGSPEAMRQFAQYMQQGMAMQLDAGTRDLLRQELRQELRAEMRAELREEIRQEIIEAEVKARVAAEFESRIEAEVRDRVEAEVLKRLRVYIKEMEMR